MRGKALFIGGTGIISSACTLEAIAQGWQVFHLNRGNKKSEYPGVEVIQADIHDEAGVKVAVANRTFDVVVDFLAFTPKDIERGLRLFGGRTSQFVFISSFSGYQKPPTHYVITESTPLLNPYWDYSSDKIACEERLMRAYRDDGFPVTIVRPAFTYSPWTVPAPVGPTHDYTIVDRIIRGKPVLVHGDGTSLWTLTHHRDFARGFTPLLGNPQAIGHAFHITSDDVLNWNQIVQTLGRAVGKTPELVHLASDTIARLEPEWGPQLLGSMAWTMVMDNSKIKKFVPGYSAQIPFEDGAREIVAWFDAEPSRRTVDEAENRRLDALIAVALGKRD